MATPASGIETTSPPTGPMAALPGPVEVMPAGVGAVAARAIVADAVAILDEAGVLLGAADRMVLAWVAGLAEGGNAGRVAVLASLLARAVGSGVGSVRPGPVVAMARALIIPADQARPCAVTALRLSSVAFSDVIGGGLLDDALCESAGGARYVIYLDAERREKRLARNGRAAILAARLGWIDRIDRIDVRGDVLIVGSNLRGDDVDVPRAVVAAARACRLLADPTTGIAR